MDPHSLFKPLDGHVRGSWRFWSAFFAGFALILTVLYATYYKGVPERDFFAAAGATFRGSWEYTLYTGTVGGTYDRLGKDIAKLLQENPDAHMRLKLVNTNGSLENAMMLNGRSRAFALVTEPLAAGLYEGPVPAAQRVALLYMQRTFLAYNKTRWQAFVSAHCPGAAPASLRLTDDRTSCAYRYLGQARWDAGPIGGGGRMILNHLLHAAGLRLHAIESSPLIALQADRLRAGEVDVAFCFAGDLNAVFDAVRASGAKTGAEPLGMTGVDPQLGIELRSIELQPNFFTDEEGRQVETLGAYAVLVATPDVPPGDAAVVVRKAAAFVDKMANGGEHLQNVAAALEGRSKARNAHLFGVAGQFALIMVTWALLCAVAVTAFDSRLNRRRIMQEHSRLLQQLRRPRSLRNDAADREVPPAPLSNLPEFDAAIDRTRTTIHELAVAGRLSLPHRDQLLASATSVEAELKRAIRCNVATLGAGERAWLQQRGYLDATELPGAP